MQLPISNELYCFSEMHPWLMAGLYVVSVRLIMPLKWLSTNGYDSHGDMQPRPSSCYADFVYIYTLWVFTIGNVRKCYSCYHFKHKPQRPDSMQFPKALTDSNGSEHRHPAGCDKGSYVLGKNPCRIHDKSQTVHEDQANDRSQGWKSSFQQQHQQLLPFFNPFGICCKASIVLTSHLGCSSSNILLPFISSETFWCHIKISLKLQ